MTASMLVNVVLPLTAKDSWDKAQIIGQIVTALFVTGAIGIATLVYNRKQTEAANAQKAQDIKLAQSKAVAELIPYLGSDDPRHVEAALIVTAEIADDALAGRFALLYGKEGGFAALSRLRQALTHDVAARAEQSFSALIQEIAKSVVRVQIEASPYKGGTDTYGTVVGAPDLVIAPHYMLRHSDGGAHILTEGKHHMASVELHGEGDDDPITVLQSETRLKALRVAPAASLRVGGEAFVLGYGDGRWTAYPATIEIVGQGGNLLLDSPVTPDDGTPVLDKDGALLGMVMSTGDLTGRGRVTAAGPGQIRAALRSFFDDATTLEASE